MQFPKNGQSHIISPTTRRLSLCVTLRKSPLSFQSGPLFYLWLSKVSATGEAFIFVTSYPIDLTLHRPGYKPGPDLSTDMTAVSISLGR